MSGRSALPRTRFTRVACSDPGVTVIRISGSLGPRTWAWSALALLTTAFVISSPFGSWTARIVWDACVSAIVVARARLDTERHAPTRALVGLSALLVYIAAMRTGSVVARERARTWLAARDVTPVTLMAGPLPLDPWRRDVIVGLADRYEFLVVDLRNGEISAADPPSGEATTTRRWPWLSRIQRFGAFARGCAIRRSTWPRPQPAFTY